MRRLHEASAARHESFWVRHICNMGISWPEAYPRRPDVAMPEIES
jgi:hypothetical protein